MPSHYDTLQLHAGREKVTHNPCSYPVYLSTSSQFEDSHEGAQLFGLEKDGFIYSRINNPSVGVFENRLAELEGGIGALATSSGQAAQLLAIGGLAHAGHNIISTSYLYGGTYNQFKVAFKRLGIETRFVNGNNVEDFKKLIDENTRAIYLESIGNPAFNVPDFEKIVKLAHDNGLPVVVDNTFGAGGFLINPIAHGADIVTHSATKWIGGHGTTIAGAVIDSGNFPWTQYPEKYPQFSKPSEGYHGLILNDALGKAAYIGHLRIELLRDLGPALNPFASFLLLQGLETLSLRVERQSDNALKLAKWFEKNPNVKSISYLGLPSHETHELAKKYLNNDAKYFGSVLAIEVKDLKEKPENPFDEASPKVVDNLKIALNLANVGDSKTLVIAPYYTTHQQLSEEEKKAAGVTKGLIRISVGTEFIDDIIEDFDQAFKKVYN
ncbi:MET15 [Candida pseudojiufengensis]|uniref:MET15 n=1 Tax=Candida pseudojiufengensis TaxID=497109 RepID=UPI002224F975|nr:MET15 [Candida pseudojiufengensis]KAI5962077.1 MET15 [Candida pseudojiufengensis]